MLAMNDEVGLAASAKAYSVALTDAALFDFPLIYMHGRSQFDLSGEERLRLRQYLERGGVLMGDACCGAKPFDKSFRELITQVFPDRPFQRIPIDHVMFSAKIGNDVRRLKRRSNEVVAANAPLETQVQEVETFLEGIELDGRYVVIYSKYDISCALERRAALNCEGYVPEDAVKLATNILLYATLQDVRLDEKSARKPETR